MGNKLFLIFKRLAPHPPFYGWHVVTMVFKILEDTQKYCGKCSEPTASRPCLPDGPLLVLWEPIRTVDGTELMKPSLESTSKNFSSNKSFCREWNWATGKWRANREWGPHLCPQISLPDVCSQDTGHPAVFMCTCSLAGWVLETSGGSKS